MPPMNYDDEELAKELDREEGDARYAMKVEQEMRDEDLARQLARAEERALAAEERARGPPPRRPWTIQRACSYCVPLIIVVVGLIALIIALQRNGTAMAIPVLGDVTNPGQFWEDSDPWEGVAPGEVVKWRSPGTGGLSLIILDALESKWEDIFHITVAAWDDGDPEVLLLATEKKGHDPECEPEDGRSKVCNGNYGPTDWRGINQVNIQSGFIYSSTSRMNEFYLEGASDAQKQYTMCHEMGHGFGLPHTDENFFNADLGNCMDYTANPAANVLPGKVNFEFLEQLYGTLPTRTRRTQELRSLVGRDSNAPPAQRAAAMPESIRAKLREIMPVLEGSSDSKEHEHHGWRLLRSTEHAVFHEAELGDGWSVQVHKLLVSPEDRV